MKLLLSLITLLNYYLALFFLGPAAQGEKLPNPTFKSTYPPKQISQEEWFNELNVGLLSHRKAVFFG